MAWNRTLLDLYNLYRRTRFTCIAKIIVILFPVQCLADFSGDIAVVSNYLQQGLTSSSNEPALQANLQYSMPKNFYTNLWASSVNFLTTDNTRARQEFEIMLGNQGQINDDWSYNVWVGQYYYPGATGGNYPEINLSLIYKYFTLITDYSNNYYATQTDGDYTEFDVNYPLTTWHTIDFAFIGSFGRFLLHPIAGGNYDYYTTGFSATIKKLVFSVQYTNVCAESPAIGAVPNTHWVGSLTYNF